METKICTKCKQDKSIKLFHLRGDNKKRLRSHCIECLKKDNKKRINKYRKNNISALKETENLYNDYKICVDCNLSKPLIEFSKNVAMKLGVGSFCKLCSIKRGNTWHKSNKGRYSSYRNSAEKRNYKFNLSFEEFDSIINKNCFYCDKKPALGIDRKDNNVGYELTNCLPCCTICNQMKWDKNTVSFLEHIKKIYENLKCENVEIADNQIIIQEPV